MSRPPTEDLYDIAWDVSDKLGELLDMLASHSGEAFTPAARDLLDLDKRLLSLLETEKAVTEPKPKQTAKKS